MRASFRWCAKGPVIGFSIRRLRHLQFSTTLATRPAAQRRIAPEQGVDRYIWNRIEDGVETVHLESPAAGPRAFASAPLDEQTRFLSHVVEDTKISQTEIDDMISAWRAGKKGWLAQFLKQRFRQFPRASHSLFTERNQAWMPCLTAMADDGVPTLVVVGALHCVSTAGLPALLAKRREPSVR
jgi:uncharacterized protein YbaP (TraB family)